MSFVIKFFFGRVLKQILDTLPLNGYKTLAGAVVAAIVLILQAAEPVASAEWQPWIKLVLEPLTQTALYVSAIGALHKGTKTVSESE